MWKWIFFLGAAWLLFKLMRGDLKRKMAPREEPVETVTPTGELVNDPVCGTYVPMDSGIRVRDGEKVYCFCSYECRDTFLKQLEERGGREA